MGDVSDDPPLDELHEMLDPGAVLGPHDDLTRYTEPARGRAGRALGVARPSSTEQVRSVVGWAQRHRIAVVPQGANSGLVGASTPPPDGSTLVLSLERLNGAPVIDPLDRTAVVDAGVRLSELNASATQHGLSLPIDLGADPSLGGMAATNTGGARMLAHGDLRRHVLGVRAVIADAGCSVIDELSTLRKHNVGPSLGQLLIGAGGALGIITALAIELTPLRADRSCAWLALNDGHAAIACLRRLEHRSPNEFSAFEVVSAAALERAIALPSSPGSPFKGSPLPACTGLVELSGTAGVEDRLVSALAELSDAGLIGDAVVVPAETAWALRHSITEGLAASGVVVGFDVSVARPELPRLLEQLRAELHTACPRALLADFGHWGDGGVHANVVFPHEVTPPSDAERLALREMVLGTVVDGFNGSFSAEHGIGPTNAAWWTSTTPVANRAVLASIRDVVDPLRVLGHPGLPYSG